MGGFQIPSLLGAIPIGFAAVALALYIVAAVRAGHKADMAKGMNCCLAGAGVAGAGSLMVLALWCALYPDEVKLPFKTSIELPLFFGGAALMWIAVTTIREALSSVRASTTPAAPPPKKGPPDPPASA